MAIPHISFNDQLPDGRRLRRMLQQAEESDEAFPQELQHMINLCEGGDPGQVTNFTEVTNRYGFANNTKAKEAFDEFNSANAKTSGNGSVDNVRAARDQLYAKLRG